MASERKEDLSPLYREIVNQLAVIVRMAQIHNPTNVAVLTSLEKFVAALTQVLSLEGQAELELVGEYFYMNGERVKYSMEYLLNFDFIQREFKKRSLGRLRFQRGVKQEDMQAFLSAFIHCQYAPEPYEDLAAALEPVRCIEPGVLRKIVDVHDVRKAVKHTYFNAVSFTMGLMNKIGSGERVSMKKAKRVVETMVDALLEKEELLLGMTAIKNYDDYTYHHCVNVSIFSVALGQRLGLNKKALMDLGLVALFHDIGKTEVPPELLNKPSSLNEEEWEVLKRHPVLGVKSIFKMKDFDQSSARAAIVSYEHHVRLDETGYPKIADLSGLDLYSRIVSIADQYDAMTSSRVYAREPLSPDKAISFMAQRVGTQLDPLLFKFFVNLVGIFPVGSFVMLDTRELGIVSGVNQSEPLRPKVTVITDARGHKAEPRVVDLSEKKEDRYLRSILRTLDPNKYRVNIAEYIF